MIVVIIYAGNFNITHCGTLLTTTRTLNDNDADELLIE
jgi:hypothetical protein